MNFREILNKVINIGILVIVIGVNHFFDEYLVFKMLNGDY